MAVRIASTSPVEGRVGLATLQERIHRLQDSVPRTPVAGHPVLEPLLTLRTGAAYGVDSAGLAMLLLAGPSAQGAWTAVVGDPDFGVEAAVELGVELDRTVLVPRPGEHWLEATAALIDVVTLVVLRPPPGVTARTTNRLAARLRKRSAALVAWGEWPGCEARLSLASSTWTGADQGHGRLRGRQVAVEVRRGSAPPRRVDLAWPGAALTRVEPVLRLEAPA